MNIFVTHINLHFDLTYVLCILLYIITLWNFTIPSCCLFPEYDNRRSTNTTIRLISI